MVELQPKPLLKKQIQNPHHQEKQLFSCLNLSDRPNVIRKNNLLEKPCKPRKIKDCQIFKREEKIFFHTFDNAIFTSYHNL